jgi:hypothetical protein
VYARERDRALAEREAGCIVHEIRQHEEAVAPETPRAATG